MWGEDPLLFTAFHAAVSREVEATIDLGWAILFRYRVGVWSRAALAVLKEMEKTEE